MPTHDQEFMGLSKNPLQELELWVQEAQKTGDQFYNAMSMSTVDSLGNPDCRVVLLKGIENEKLVFFTSYDSKKSQDLEKNPQVCLNFFWQQFGRQVRLHGVTQKVDRNRSEDYFQTRPRLSQVSASISEQSHKISGRKFLEDAANGFAQEYDQKNIPCPQNWGGYEVSITRVEFWLAHPFRLHSRVVYEKHLESWERYWIAP